MFEFWIIPLHTVLTTLYLSADEQTRAAQFCFEPDRNRFQRSHSAVRSILGGKLGVDPLLLNFGRHPQGKPYLIDSSLQFNLSHAGNLALCAVADLAVGVDVEQLRPIPDWQALASMMFSPHEQQALTATPADHRDTIFLNLWTRKEAIVKAAGQGITDALNAFSVPAISVTALMHLAVCTLPAAQQSYSLYGFVPAESYLGAVAIEGNQAVLPTVRMFIG